MRGRARTGSQWETGRGMAGLPLCLRRRVRGREARVKPASHAALEHMRWSAEGSGSSRECERGKGYVGGPAPNRSGKRADEGVGSPLRLRRAHDRSSQQTRVTRLLCKAHEETPHAHPVHQGLATGCETSGRSSVGRARAHAGPRRQGGAALGEHEYLVWELPRPVCPLLF